MTDKTAYAALILRVSLGTVLIAHGLLKVLVFTIPGTVGFFESIGIPGWMAYLVIMGELGGGVLLILGIYTSQISLAILPILLGASYVHIGNGWMFSNENGGWEYPVFLCITSVTVYLLGSGAFAMRLPWTSEESNQN